MTQAPEILGIMPISHGSQARFLILAGSLFWTSGWAAPASLKLADRSKSGDPKQLFVSLPATLTGISSVNPIDVSHPLKRLYTSAFAGGGLAAGDFDSDGRCDLYFVSGPRSNRLYRNMGAGKFEDITEPAGVGGGDSWGAGVAAVDLDSDGDLDLYVCNYSAPNQLFLNDGHGRFTESAARFGLDQQGAYLMPAFADYDLDGDLDVYLLAQRFYRAGGRPKRPITVFKNGKLQVLPEFADYYGVTVQGNNKQVNNVGAKDKLLRNDGGRFVDVTDRAGISDGRFHGNSATWWDFNHDGLPDLYVGNDFQDPDLLYRNNGNGSFTEVARQQLAHTTWFTMGADCGDFNNDGRMDLLVADMAGTTHYKSKTTMGNMGVNNWFMQTADPPQYMRNCFYVNTGRGRFLETAFSSGLAYSDWTWAVKAGDLDCDGRLDVFLTNGITRSFNNSDKPLDLKKLHGNTEWDLYEDTPARPEKNLAFRNLGGLKFENASDSWGLGMLGISYGAAWFDLEGDGDLDLAVANLDAPPGIFRNDLQNGNRVVIRLRGSGGNQSAIGASLKVRTSAGEQIRQFNPMRGYCSCDEGLLHFGLGESKIIEELTINWPGGLVSRYENLAVNRTYTFSQGEARTSQPEIENHPPPLFRSSDALAAARHWEMPFDDFNLQPLLPNRQSQWGPGLACGDIDGDGDEDFYLGGCSGYVGTLIVNDGQGRFRASPFTAAEGHKLSEDQGALFFDFDGDDDLDLFVVSGSVEQPPTNGAYTDRLYLNDGSGNFAPARFGAVPLDPQSGSVVTAADYDRDGDLDLFVGGRVLPGAYPNASRSKLLENRAGSFSDVAFKSPALLQRHLVTGAVWSDADNDGWIDLLVSTEWGPVRFFRNEKGKLVDQTEAAGLSEVLGWWTGINAADVDNDGDLDYLATNFGLNTKYKASPKAPEILFYGDFEGTGRNRIVEAGFEDGVCYPHRGFSCSRNAMPFVGQKLKSFHAFAKSTLPEIYPTTKLDNSLQLKANTLATGIFFNDGKARFTFRPLPGLAQSSPSFGSTIFDATGDGNPDLFLAQNFFGPQIETRPMNNGLGVLLAGDGKGAFAPLWPAQSGILIPEDAKSVAVTDLDGDQLLDLAVAVNDGPMRTFIRSGGSAPFTVVLRGNKGNSRGIGARLSITLSDGSRQTGEIRAGSGYLSQSPALFTFTTADDKISPTSITVRWPDGSESVASATGGERRFLIEKP